MAGHAGTRVGWAVVADKEVADRMNEYIGWTTNWAFDNQRRAALILEHVLATEGVTPSRHIPPLIRLFMSRDARTRRSP